MNTFRQFILAALIVAFGVGMAGDSFAQKDPNRGDTRLEDRKERGRQHDLLGFFIKNVECREVLLAQMSTDDAASFNRLLASVREGNAKIQELRGLLRRAREAGDREAFARISAELKTLYSQQGRIHTALSELMRKYADVAMRIRKECGETPTDKDRGDNTGDVKDQSGIIVTPNPVRVGGTAVLNFRLAEESSVSVTVTDQSGVVLQIPAAQLAAGEQKIMLDVSSLARGVYVVQVQIGDKVHMVKLMIS